MKMPLSSKTAAEVEADIKRFDVRYKRDWQSWMSVYDTKPLSSAEVAGTCRAVLSKWQAVRSKTKGRTIRLLRDAAIDAPCFDDLLAKATEPVRVLGRTTIRDLRLVGGIERDALSCLWEVFRDLPTIGRANAVGITKAIKLVTGGRIGPALDSEVRDRLAIKEPVTASEWITVLESVAEDIEVFESTNQCRLEDLVEAEWQPVAPGRAYDMVFGPRAKSSG
ncbi:MAG: hypothetical protein Q8T13_17215 [Acidobacteriota bacterium]|nr:hypothetical protein [Acidobacteriota bacterium]